MMKKLFTLIAFLCAMGLSAQTLLVEWTFPNNSADTLADDGINENLGMLIATEGGTSAIQYKNGFDTKAAQATGWDNGADTKAWFATVYTKGYDNIRLNSKQQSGGNDAGPLNWKLQYKIGTGGTWTDIAGSDYIVRNDWTTGEISDFQMPADCNDQYLVFIRWIMTTNMASDSNNVLNTGKSKIDDIRIYGNPVQSVKGLNIENNMNIYPNPASDHITISNAATIKSFRIVNQFGQEVMNTSLVNNSIDVSGLARGIYFLIPSDGVEYSKAVKFVKN